MTSREELEETERATRDGDIAFVMGDPRGRRFVARVLYAAAHIKSVTYSADRNEAAFHEGQRSVGATIEGELERACPDLRDTMEIERIRNERTRAAQTVPSESESSP